MPETGTKKKRKQKKQSLHDRIQIVFIIGLLILAVSLVIMTFNFLTTGETSETVNKDIPIQTPEQRPELSLEAPANTIAAPPVPVLEPDKAELPPQNTVVFLIDDAGNNLSELEPFLRFPGSLTIAVLPGLPHSAEAARRIRAAGKEVFLHQPMEAVGGQNPGPGAVYVAMDASEIKRIVAKNLDEIGPVKGLNNHQGSRVSRDAGCMKAVIELCKERGIYFVDSKTIGDSAAGSVAKELNTQIGERDIFIDNERDTASMRRSINEGLSVANKKGYSIMIGHAWSAELPALLAALYPVLLEQGYELKTISEFLSQERN
ncbi:divergent polysaccharide deacetylase family protein [Breznakiellaceae bacterium SP9]